MSYSFLLKLIHLIIKKYPILTPFILRQEVSVCDHYNIMQILLETDQQKLESLSSANYSKKSFLEYIVSELTFFMKEKFWHLINEISLDTYIYIESAEQ